MEQVYDPRLEAVLMVTKVHSVNELPKIPFQLTTAHVHCTVNLSGVS